MRGGENHQHLYIHLDPYMLTKIDYVIRLLERIDRKVNTTLAEIDDLEAGVAEQTTVTASLKQVVDNMADQLDDIVDNETEIAALKARITAVSAAARGNTGVLAQLVLENTPAPPEPPTDGGNPIPPDGGTPPASGNTDTGSNTPPAPPA